MVPLGSQKIGKTLLWRHNEHDGVWNHQPHPRHWPMWGEFSYKGPVTRKMFPFDDAIMVEIIISLTEPLFFKDLWYLPQDVHPLTKVMADFFQTRKSTWYPHPICTIFDECIECITFFHFPYKIYWHFELTLYGECNFFKIKFESSLISCNEIRRIQMKFSKPQTSDAFLISQKISWRLTPLLQNHERISVGHCVSLSVSLCMLI